MELLVATWTLRLALVGALAVGGLSYSVGTPLVESIDRAAIAAFVFTFLGRLIMGWLETPEQRVLRMRARRDKERAKASTGSKGAKAPSTPGSMAHPGPGTPRPARAVARPGAAPNPAPGPAVAAGRQQAA